MLVANASILVFLSCNNLRRLLFAKCSKIGFLVIDYHTFWATVCLFLLSDTFLLFLIRMLWQKEKEKCCRVKSFIWRNRKFVKLKYTIKANKDMRNGTGESHAAFQ